MGGSETTYIGNIWEGIELVTVDFDVWSRGIVDLYFVIVVGKTVVLVVGQHEVREASQVDSHHSYPFS